MPAGDGEVLAEGRDRPSVDIAGADHHAVGGQILVLHAEMARLMTDMAAHFLECGFLEQRGEPVAGGHQPLGAALGELFDASAIADLRLPPPQVLKQVGELGHSVTLHALAVHDHQADGELRLGRGCVWPSGVRKGDRSLRFQSICYFEAASPEEASSGAKIASGRSLLQAVFAALPFESARRPRISDRSTLP